MILSSSLYTSCSVGSLTITFKDGVFPHLVPTFKVYRECHECEFFELKEQKLLIVHSRRRASSPNTIMAEAPQNFVEAVEKGNEFEEGSQNSPAGKFSGITGVRSAQDVG